MRLKPIATCFLIVWLGANGAMLDVAQLVAWGRMFAGYIHSMPVGEALRETLDPAKPCRWCCAVQRARAATRRQTPAPVTAAIKLVLFCEGNDGFEPPAAGTEAMDAGPTGYRSWRDPVPVPPPRLGVGFVA